MRDGVSRTSSAREATGTSTHVSVARWRARVRATVLGELAHATKELGWTEELLLTLLEELHVTEEFEKLVGDHPVDVVRDAPRLLALALFLRHSWDPDDLFDVVRRVLCVQQGSPTHPSTSVPSGADHRRPPRPRHVRERARIRKEPL